MSELETALALGDDALVAAQRLAGWCSRAPDLEEDIALTNIALDQLGAARLLLSRAGELEGEGRDEDDLAYLREDREFRNLLLVELPDRDFAFAVAKLLFLSAYQRDRYQDLATGSAGSGLAGIGATAVKESAYHLDYATLWTLRLGDGTDESHARMQRAVDELWPYTYEPFEDDDPSARSGWRATVEPVLAGAGLVRPADGGWAPAGGRRGIHTEYLSYLLAELQVLHRAHPGAQW